MPPVGSVATEVTELHNSLLISIRSGPRMPCPYHLSSDKQSNWLRGPPVPQSLSLKHSTIVLVPVCNSNSFKLLFCSYLALIYALHS